MVEREDLSVGKVDVTAETSTKILIVCTAIVSINCLMLASVMVINKASTY